MCIRDSLRSFLLKLGGRTPEPAGGAALALAGASAAALLSLACHSKTRGQDGVSGEDDLLLTTQRRAERLSDEMQMLIDADVAAYREVTQALRLPSCLLYTSDAADDLTRVDLGGRR